MRGDDQQLQTGMFSYVSLEDRIPADHPLRGVRKLVEAVLAAMLRSMRLPVATGRKEMLGSTAVVLNWRGDSGQVTWKDEVWEAHAGSHHAFMPGEEVLIDAVSGLTLTVKPARRDHLGVISAAPKIRQILSRDGYWRMNVRQGRPPGGRFTTMAPLSGPHTHPWRFTAREQRAGALPAANLRAVPPGTSDQVQEKRS